MTQEREENKQKVYITNAFQTRTCQMLSQTPKEDFKYKYQISQEIKQAKRDLTLKRTEL